MAERSHCHKGHDLSVYRRKTPKGQTYCFICKKETDAKREITDIVRRNEIRRRCHLKKKYSMTLMQYKALYNKQKGLCAICHSPIIEHGSHTHIDHCHTSKAVRGLLCRYCNVGLGHFKEDLTRFRKAMAYIRKHKK